MTYRNDVDALVARHDALDAEVTRIQRDRDQLRSLIDNKRARLRLPILDNLHVASPCKEDWNAMSGDARVRHCGRCDQNVYNLSEMTREEAESLLFAKEGKLCARYYRRKHDGAVMTKDCPLGRTRKRRWLFGLGFLGMVLGVIGGWFALRKSPRQYTLGSVGSIDDEIEVMQGNFPARPEPPGGPADDDRLELPSGGIGDEVHHRDEPQVWRVKP
ncbi:MAG: hypothetical protein H0T46_04650 [Deltaproteobacteria bacterium]|nr:hypothetical protein [Deltaproteobacteria bacterium]